MAGIVDSVAVNWLLLIVIQNHPFLQTNQNQMSISKNTQQKES